MSVERATFGELNGKPVYRYTITNNHENSVSILTLGATLQSIVLKDKNGEPRDILLGFDTVEGYMTLSNYQGATVGPVCNRIGGAKFTVGGKCYELVANEKDVNCLHSGGEFSFTLWDAIVADADAVEFSYVSPDGVNGFPGEIAVKVLFTFGDDNALHIRYHAVSTRDTFINLTNHAYFNLNGYDAGHILDHEMRINADAINAVDDLSIPTGELMPVEGTPFDFRQGKKIGAEIEADHVQLKRTGGYDHNFCLNGCDGTLQEAGSVFSAESGIRMDFATTLPGVQFYAGNYLSGRPGKEGKPMEKRTGFCLETQFYPDTPNRPEFPSCLYKSGEAYASETVYAFIIQQ